MDVHSRRGDVFQFGDFTLEILDRSLSRRARRIHLAPKTWEVLVALVTSANRLMTKRELLESVWPDVVVEEGILTVHVAYLRRVLGDVKGSPRYIETVSRVGYRFVAPVVQRASVRRHEEAVQ
jgi:DNA-binding winged helix-turn-helix (wHTH) protein